MVRVSASNYQVKAKLVAERPMDVALGLAQLAYQQTSPFGRETLPLQQPVPLFAERRRTSKFLLLPRV
ncbi:hypothetical protein TUM17567_15580 [Citrobacter amalonaticus]|nr:hypothetical protein TUM17567_15580 [Citrobacter amalonaticus]